MYCKKCGTQNDDNAQQCSNCGAELHSTPATSQAQIPNYLVQSILVTLFCCLPLGIPAIIFASQVNTKLQAGDLDGAAEASQKAKKWCWWSFGVGLAL
jgi:hypothetical protein